MKRSRQGFGHPAQQFQRSSIEHECEIQQQAGHTGAPQNCLNQMELERVLETGVSARQVTTAVIPRLPSTQRAANRCIG